MSPISPSYEWGEQGQEEAVPVSAQSPAMVWRMAVLGHTAWSAAASMYMPRGGHHHRHLQHGLRKCRCVHHRVFPNSMAVLCVYAFVFVFLLPFLFLGLVCLSWQLQSICVPGRCPSSGPVATSTPAHAQGDLILGFALAQMGGSLAQVTVNGCGHRIGRGCSDDFIRILSVTRPWKTLVDSCRRSLSLRCLSTQVILDP